MICLIGRSDMVFPFCRQEARRLDVARGGLDNSSLHELDVERDGHLVANENATSLERGVPGQAEVFTVDLCGSRYRNSGIAPRILRWRGWTFNGKDHLASDSANGQVALDGQFSVPSKADARGLEEQRGEFLHVEEVGALQVRIALGVAGFDRGCFNQGLDIRVCQV